MRAEFTADVLDAHRAFVPTARDLRSPRFLIHEAGEPSLVWMSATTLYWSIAKIEALGTVGTEYRIVDCGE